MRERIFISYRRDDVAGDAHALYRDLERAFGTGGVFLDFADLLPGLRFEAELAKELGACDILLAVIGPQWMDLLNAKAAGSERDWVRAEIARRSGVRSL